MCKIQPTSVLKLYKDLLRYGQHLTFTDKKFFRQRIINEFKNNKNLKDEAEISYNFEVSDNWFGTFGSLVTFVAILFRKVLVCFHEDQFNDASFKED